jgi:hypothetical protein
MSVTPELALRSKVLLLFKCELQEQQSRACAQRRDHRPSDEIVRRQNLVTAGNVAGGGLESGFPYRQCKRRRS